MIYCILGQTASGKTSLALKLAREFSLPIISADAYQCYKIMQVGTDKPTKEEVDGIPYYFYDQFMPNEDISVFDFQNIGREIIDKYQKENKDIIVVGGNFLYVKALLFNYVFKKEEKDAKYESLSLSQMQELLKKRSIETYNSIDINNSRRVIRALIQLDNGMSHSSIKDKNDGNPIYDVEFYKISIDKDEGNKKIDARIDEMVKNGLVDEVKYLYKTYPSSTRIFTTIGYVEIIDAIKENRDIDDSVINLIKTHTHQYAKKQRTFLKHQFNEVITASKDEIYKILSKKMRKD